MELPEPNFERALVTGGAGFIGSNLANFLEEQGVDVIAIDNEFLGTPENLKDGVTYRQKDILDDDLPVDVDVVFNFASRSSYPLVEEEPTESVRVNVEGFVNVIEQARAAGCDTIVYASSSSVYGTHTEPQPEDVMVSANSGYEATKLCNERYAEYYSTHYQLNMVGIRPYSVYEGFSEGEGHKDEFANIISKFAHQLANGETPQIYGDGTQTRDFIHVSDVVRAFYLAAYYNLDGIYNVGAGDPHSLNEVVEILNKELGTDIEPEYIETPIPNDVYVKGQYADYTKLYSETGWEPQITFEEGIQQVATQYIEENQ